jgi:hypothetical protein
MEVSGQLYAPAALLQASRTGTHWTGGGVGPRAGLDAVVRRSNNTCLYRESNRGLPTRSLLRYPDSIVYDGKDGSKGIM